MTRRRTLYVAVGLVITLCAIGLAVSYWNVTKAERAYAHIKVGMRPSEVAGLLGKPIEDRAEADRAFHRATYDVKESNPQKESVSEPPKKIDVWAWPDETIVVAYNSDYKVSRYYLCRHRRSLLDRLREWIGW